VTIGGSAFLGCPALTSVYIPAATSIGGSAFRDYGTEDLTITLGTTAPTLGIDIFSHSSALKNVTVKVLLDKTAYGVYTNDDGSSDNWGNALRGKGWDGNSYLTGTVNTSITLTIEEQ
jgi:hypothetical protein